MEIAHLKFWKRFGGKIEISEDVYVSFVLYSSSLIFDVKKKYLLQITSKRSYWLLFILVFAGLSLLTVSDLVISSSCVFPI